MTTASQSPTSHGAPLLSHLPSPSSSSSPSSTSCSPTIRPLSSSLSCLLRSSHLILSLPMAVCEVVENAIDSRASVVRVSLDASTLSFTVTDNGHGLTQRAMSLVGRRHHTSKAHPHPGGGSRHPALGVRGEALASLAVVATVDIHSTPLHDSPRSASQPRTYHKRLTSAAASAVTAQSPSASCGALGPHGTTVAVRQFFAAFPVRRRQLLQRAARQAELTRRRLERVALVHPEVALSIMDDETGRLVLYKGRVKDVTAAFGELYRHDLAASFLVLTHAPPTPSLSAITLRLSSLSSGYHTREYQFLYINARPVHHAALHRLIAHVWMRCVRMYSGGTLHTHGQSASLTLPGGRLVYPAWVCELIMDEDAFDCLSEADKSLVWLAHEDAVLDAVRQCMRAGIAHRYPVLAGHDEELFAASDDRRGRPPGESTAVGSPSRDASPPRAFIDLTATAPTVEVDVARPGTVSLSPAPMTMIDLVDDGTLEAAALMSPASVAHRSPVLSTVPSHTASERVAGERPRSIPHARQRRESEPTSARKVRRVVDLSEKTPSSAGDRPFRPLAPIPLGELHRREEKEPIDLTAESTETERPPLSLRAAPLARPAGPALRLPPPPPAPSAAARRPSAPPPPSGLSTLYQRWSSVHSSDPTAQRFHAHDSSRLTPVRPSSPISLDRSMLRRVRLVGQVDRKFLLGVVDRGLLLAIDQHAADERVRLEDLETHLDRLLHSEPLPSPTVLDLSTREAHTLATHRQQVEAWGWRLQSDPAVSLQPALSPLLVAVPAVLSSSLETRDLQLYLAQLSASFHALSHRQLPDVLLQLLHSRACRTAIRFGDALSEEQQAALVAALSACALPFQCAHGRPSMVPIVRLDNAGSQQEVGNGQWKREVRRRLKGLSVAREPRGGGLESNVAPQPCEPVPAD